MQLKTGTAKKEGGEGERRNAPVTIKQIWTVIRCYSSDDDDPVGIRLLPPTIENCRKCAFNGYWMPKNYGIKTGTRICQFGQGGYFVKNYTRGVIDVMSYLEWKKEK